MSSATVMLRRADADSIGAVEQLLERNDLPASDVRSSPTNFFIGVDPEQRDGERVVGVGGIEAYPPHGLLRSVVVKRSDRGKGYGTALCDELEQFAREEGVETLYLLTTTAAEFFADRGYVPTDRDAVPDVIQATTEFAELCPDSATCLSREL